MDKNDTTFGKFDTSNNTQPISETSSTISVGSTGSRINMNDNFNIISNATDGLRDTISSINNNHFHVEGFNEILSKLKDIDQKIEGLKNYANHTYAPSCPCAIHLLHTRVPCGGGLYAANLLVRAYQRFYVHL